MRDDIYEIVWLIIGLNWEFLVYMEILLLEFPWSWVLADQFSNDRKYGFPGNCIWKLIMAILMEVSNF